MCFNEIPLHFSVLRFFFVVQFSMSKCSAFRGQLVYYTSIVSICQPLFLIFLRFVRFIIKCEGKIRIFLFVKQTLSCYLSLKFIKGGGIRGGVYATK